MEKMDVAESQLAAFSIISSSGLARASVHEAMEAMRSKNWEISEAKMVEAENYLREAHQAQTDLLHKFANGVEIEIQIIMVHAQDHLMTTMTLKEVAEEMKYLYSRLPEEEASEERS